MSAGRHAQLASGGDTRLTGAVVTAPTVTATVGGDLNIASVQDTRRYQSRQQQVSGSLVIGPASSGQLTVAGSRIDADYASVTTVAGLQAGDGGFDVAVAGDTTLTGAAIASTPAAVDADRNRFATGGELTLNDVTNHARYEARAHGVSLGTSISPQGQYQPRGTGMRLGGDSDHQTSVTRAGISGVAGNTGVRTGDAANGVVDRFDADRVQRDISAQVTITQEFSTRAPKAVADYAQQQVAQLDARLAQTTDPAQRAALVAERERWQDGGRYRVALHAAVGGLAGGVGGAAGAAGSATLVPQFAAALEKTDLPASVKRGLLASAGTLVGAAAGGNTGAAAALGETANNFLSHAEAREREAARQQLQQCADDACRQQARQTIERLNAIDQWRDRQINDACRTPASALCRGWQATLAEVAQSYRQTYVARDDPTQGVAGERRQVVEQDYLYRRRVEDPFAFGVAKGLMKLTPPALVAGVGVGTYALTTAIMDVGATEAAIAIARGLADLPGELRARLNSADPTVQGEALVDTLSLVGVSGVIAGKLQQSGSKAVVVALEAQARLDAEVRAIAKARIENNVYRDSSRADPGKPVYSPTGPWTPAAQLSISDANRLLERSLPAGVQRIAVESADGLNVKVLKDKPHFTPPYVPGTQAVTIETTTATHFVRYYVQNPQSSKQVGEWMMRAEDVATLSPEQVASKFSLPQVPTHRGDVVVPAGNRLRVTIANDINIWADRSLGGNGGGGGVQFELLTAPKDIGEFKTWFMNERLLK